MSAKKHEYAKGRATRLEASRRTRHGPEPERFKITGYVQWEEAAAVLVRKQKPAGGWPK